MDYNKKIASVWQYTGYYFQSAYSIFNFVFRNKKIITNDFVERIMLAVTEVNGCKVCCQAHSKMALESGISNEEISALLSYDQDKVPQEQSVGVVFATYYADKNGKIEKHILQKLYKEYGRKNAKSIIAVCRMIMIGNTLGIAMDTAKERKKGNKKTGSTFLREFFLFFNTILFFPLYITTTIIGLIINH